MICMIPMVNLGVREMLFNVCDFHVSLKQPLCQGDINSTNLPCSTSVHPIL